MKLIDKIELEIRWNRKGIFRNNGYDNIINNKIQMKTKIITNKALKREK